MAGSIMAVVKRAVLAAPFLVVATSSARGAQVAKPYRLEYAAHDGCPSSAVFVAAIGRRLPGASLEAAAPLGLEIEIQRKGASSHGVLVADDGALRTVREVDAKTCDEVVEALAFIATVAIENAVVASTPKPADDAPPAPASAEAEPPVSAPKVTEHRVDAPSPAPTPRTTTTVVPSFAIGVLGAALPDLATSTALSASFGLSFARTAGLSPAVFLVAGRTPEHSLGSLDGAHARWTWGRLDACPHVLTPSITTTLTACATFTAGMLEASARTFDEVAPVQRPWITAGALARMTTWFGPVGQGLELGGEVPLRRDHLVSALRGKEASVPAVFPFLGIFLALRIP